MGVQGKPISADTQLEVWAKPLSGAQSYAVVLFNRTASAADIAVTWQQLGLASRSAQLRDLWARRDLGTVEVGYRATVPAHGVVMLEVTGE